MSASSAAPLDADATLNTDYDFFVMLRDLGRGAARQFLDQHFDNIGLRDTVDLAQEVKAEWG
jgi:NTE family protein